ncbi:flagellar export chaperone FliS [Massilia sp. Mn16-1_5]|uniref:flagellar export chaperone FliS n=1 Tax=Massilia sp. Mn16-1_5 TaxID=2079199 RepID=UPI00109E3B6E|nr:flagellar export chaperone FliS [Massilia sp. Mn16-1_5]THC39554.1 flagellar export chaperone FliS [Massilia sp. Mn16-1_5]
MFGSMQRGVNAYAKVGMETAVISASPHKLIVLLYDGAITAIKNGATHMAAGNIIEKGAAISKALDIINNGLRASLDKKAGGDIAANLDALYVYMTERLLMANLQNKLALLDEVQTLLVDLRDAWNQIGEKPVQAPSMSQYPVMASA